MQEAGKTQEVLNQATGKGLETLTLWAEANQRVLREMVELGAGAAKEGIRLYAEFQQGAIDALREGQSVAIRWQSGWQDAPKDPVQWYQKAMTETVDGTQKWFQLVEGNAQAVTRSAERLQASAEQAGKAIQQTFTDFVSKTKDIYAKN
jgi:head-tail adaptor